MVKLFVNVNGAARGSPGEAAIGVVLADERGQVVEECGERVGRAPYNAAGYKALIEGARRAIAYSPEEVVFFTDNQRVANQVNGLTPVREPHLQHLLHSVVGLLEQLPSWRVNCVEPDANRTAHRLVEQAFRERAREERERHALCQQVEVVLRTLSVDELRKVLAYVRSVRPVS